MLNIGLLCMKRKRHFQTPDWIIMMCLWWSSIVWISLGTRHCTKLVFSVVISKIAAWNLLLESMCTGRGIDETALLGFPCSAQKVFHIQRMSYKSLETKEEDIDEDEQVL